MSEQPEVIRKYSNGEITVVWRPAKCIHVAYCWKELVAVFNPRKRPWVDINGASSERIMEQVDRCPSGALTYYKNDSTKTDDKPEGKIVKTQVEFFKGGPLLVHGAVNVKLADGSFMNKVGSVAFCRCGQSKNQPFCDGTHVKTGFDK